MYKLAPREATNRPFSRQAALKRYMRDLLAAARYLDRPIPPSTPVPLILVYAGTGTKTPHPQECSSSTTAHQGLFSR